MYDINLIGKKIKQLIGNDTVYSLSQAIGYSQTNIWKLIRGEVPTPSLETITKIALYYNVSLDWFVLDKKVNNDIELVRLRKKCKELEEHAETLRKGMIGLLQGEKVKTP